MLANAKMEVAAPIAILLEACSAAELGLGRRIQVSRSAQQPRHVLRHCVQHLATRLARSQALGAVHGEACWPGSSRRSPGTAVVPCLAIRTSTKYWAF